MARDVILHDAEDLLLTFGELHEWVPVVGGRSEHLFVSAV